MAPDDPDKMLPRELEDLDEGARSPLVSESTVDYYRRAREERGKPASPESMEVGRLNQLIAIVRAALGGCRAAATRARSSAFSRELEDQAEAYRQLIERAARRVRQLGGSPPDESAPDELPKHPRDIEYATGDDALRDWLDQTRDHVDRLRERAQRDDDFRA